MHHTRLNTMDHDEQKVAGTHSYLEDYLAQLVQFWIKRGWPLAAIAVAMRHVAGGLELMRHADGTPP